MFHKEGLATASTKDAPLRKSDKRRLLDHLFKSFFNNIPNDVLNSKIDVKILQSLLEDALSLNGNGEILVRKLKRISPNSCGATSARAQHEGSKTSAKFGAVTLYLRSAQGSSDRLPVESVEACPQSSIFRTKIWPYINTTQPILMEIEHKYFDDDTASVEIKSGNQGTLSKHSSKPHQQRLVPCLPLLSIIPPNWIPFASVLVHVAVSKFLCRGANLMRSGVQSILQPAASLGENFIEAETPLSLRQFPTLKRGSIVAIYTTRNNVSPPFALGILVADYPTQMRVGPGAKGICCEVITCYGDDLWRISRDEAQRLLHANHRGKVLDPLTVQWEINANFGNPDLHEGRIVTKVGDETGYEDEHNEEGDNNYEMETENETFHKDSSMKEKEHQKSVQSLDDVHDSTKEMTILGQTNDTNICPENNAFVVPDDSDQDNLLLYSFHRALVTTVTDKILPIRVSSLYASHILPARPKGTTLDLKQTKFKKIGLFLYEQQQDREGEPGISQPTIETKPSPDGLELVAFLSKINRSHPALRRMKQHVKKEHESTSTPDDKYTPTCRKLAIVNLYQIPKTIVAALDLDPNDVAASNAASEARRGTGFLTLKEAREVLNNYIKKAGLEENSGQVMLNPSLYEALYKLSKLESRQAQRNNVTEASQSSTNVSRKDLYEGWLKKLQPAHALVAMPGSEVLALKKGSPNSIQIEIEKRQGNKKFTTYIRGLEEYGIDGTSFANDVAKRFACSASVEAFPNGRAALPKGCVECAFQGHLLEELKALLTGDENICAHGGCKNGNYFVPKVVISETLRKGVPAKKRH